ncbi:hypothetical protein PS357_08150 [Acinetobacter nosocomialis]|uniref:hypothetical protein n=1 Tax=Acinetobacter nosocomialis TaxID=106654 RepID=UPI00235DC806|nr:hypothetical protein [Acinetobacter nosocomialis]MDC9815717.1 hypothetical protein [Acinetobacter nosocomialis]MDE9404939.1 hypothetical protein [Acinetobacter nosocomialis]HDG9761575.1 hypothetical protein [Acinetobacter nosocomialis]
MSEQDLEQQDELQDDENLDIETPNDDEDRDDPESNEGEDPQEEGGEFDIVVGDEKPKEQDEDDFHGQPAPKWVKELRREKKESDRRIKELEAKLNEQNKPETIELGEKPKLEDFGYDEDNPEYIEALEKWVDRKFQLKEQERKKQEEQEKAQKVWQEKLNSYETKKTAIKSKVHDYDEAEEFARDVLTPTQQGILIHAAEKPELLIYHLGKNPQKAKELAAITDPILFAFAAAKIDAQIKMTARKPSTSPERKPSGSAALSGSVDNTLAKLRADAEKTGDYTKVNDYKRKLKQNQ